MILSGKKKPGGLMSDDGDDAPATAAEKCMQHLFEAMQDSDWAGAAKAFATAVDDHEGADEAEPAADEGE